MVQKSKLPKNVDTKSCFPKAKFTKENIFIIRKINGVEHHNLAILGHLFKEY